jgi:hypothetical protein
LENTEWLTTLYHDIGNSCKTNKIRYFFRFYLHKRK